jgi:hypothetical protein
MPKETLRIDSQILEPWREIAGILGVSLNEYAEEYIRFRSDRIPNRQHMIPDSPSLPPTETPPSGIKIHKAPSYQISTKAPDWTAL